ncbi:MAG: hypothetical protein AAF550_12485, partial [Myxococcota bacterium]
MNRLISMVPACVISASLVLGVYLVWDSGRGLTIHFRGAESGRPVELGTRHESRPQFASAKRVLAALREFQGAGTQKSSSEKNLSNPIDLHLQGFVSLPHDGSAIEVRTDLQAIVFIDGHSETGSLSAGTHAIDIYWSGDAHEHSHLEILSSARGRSTRMSNARFSPATPAYKARAQAFLWVSLVGMLLGWLGYRVRIASLEERAVRRVHLGATTILLMGIWLRVHDLALEPGFASGIIPWISVALDSITLLLLLVIGPWLLHPPCSPIDSSLTVRPKEAVPPKNRVHWLGLSAGLMYATLPLPCLGARAVPPEIAVCTVLSTMGLGLAMCCVRSLSPVRAISASVLLGLAPLSSGLGLGLLPAFGILVAREPQLRPLIRPALAGLPVYALSLGLTLPHATPVVHPMVVDSLLFRPDILSNRVGDSWLLWMWLAGLMAGLAGDRNQRGPQNRLPTFLAYALASCLLTGSLFLGNLRAGQDLMLLYPILALASAAYIHRLYQAPSLLLALPLVTLGLMYGLSFTSPLDEAFQFGRRSHTRRQIAALLAICFGPHIA